MANLMKGQIKVNLAGKDYNARLTLDALMQIEDALGKGIIKIATDMSMGDIRLRDVSQVLLPALRGGGNDLQEKEVNNLIAEAGIVKATSVVADLLAKTLTDNSDEESGGSKQEGK